MDATAALAWGRSTFLGDRACRSNCTLSTVATFRSRSPSADPTTGAEDADVQERRLGLPLGPRPMQQHDDTLAIFLVIGLDHQFPPHSGRATRR